MIDVSEIREQSQATHMRAMHSAIQADREGLEDAFCIAVDNLDRASDGDYMNRVRDLVRAAINYREMLK